MTVKVTNSSYDKDKLFIHSGCSQTAVHITDVDNLITQLTELRAKHQQENEVNKWSVADCYRVERQTDNRLKDGKLKLHRTITRCFFRNDDDNYLLEISVDREGASYTLHNAWNHEPLIDDDPEDESNKDNLYEAVFQKLCYLYNEELVWESTW